MDLCGYQRPLARTTLPLPLFSEGSGCKSTWKPNGRLCRCTVAMTAFDPLSSVPALVNVTSTNGGRGKCVAAT